MRERERERKREREREMNSIFFDLLFLSTLICLLAEEASSDKNPYPFQPYKPSSSRYVAISYSTWFPNVIHFQANGGCTWGMPSLGPYKSNNHSVIRQHALWLRDANVDFILVDWSNDILYEPVIHSGLQFSDIAYIENSTKDVFEVFSQIPGAPKIAILSGSPANRSEYAPPQRRLKAKADQIMQWFVNNETVAHQYFYLDGKPLLVDYISTPAFRLTTKWNDSRFTMRHLTGFVTDQPDIYRSDPYGNKISIDGIWSWEDRGESSFPIVNGFPEVQTITAAYRGEPCGWLCPNERAGRDNGTTFIKKWNYANKIGPRIVFVQSFNQWAGCNKKPGENMNENYSTDIEPEKGGHGDLYLKLLGQEARTFKGL